MHPTEGTRRPRDPARTRSLHLLLLPALLLAGCQAAPNLMIAAPGIFWSHATGVQHGVVDFYEVGQEIDIEAPASRIWTSLTTVANMTLLYPWIEELEVPPEEQGALDLGDSFGYVTTVKGVKETGTAVVTVLEKNRRLMLTIFSRSRGTLEVTLDPLKGGETRVSVLLTTQMHDLSLVRPASAVKAELKKGLGETLKNLKLYCEHKRIDAESRAAMRVKEIRDDETVPFDVVKGVKILDYPVDQVWDVFVRFGKQAEFFEKYGDVIPEAISDRIDIVGSGIPYKQKLGPLVLEGKAVVTNVEPKRSLSVSLFSQYDAAAEFHFLPLKDGKTEFASIYYLQIPKTYNGKPVDPESVRNDMRAHVNSFLVEMASLCRKCDTLGGGTPGTKATDPAK